MATKTASDAVWHTIDVATLPTSIGDLHAAYKAQYKRMTEARDAFEAAMSKAIDPAKGKRVVFGYRFGKLSVAVVDDDAKPVKPSSAVSLSDLIRR